MNADSLLLHVILAHAFSHIAQPKYRNAYVAAHLLLVMIIRPYFFKP